jgi:hypothetical protein
MRTRILAAGLVSAALLAGLADPAAAQQPWKQRSCRESILELEACGWHVERLVTRTYPVADLVVPINMDPASGEPFDEKQTQEAKLMQLILDTVAPDSWVDRGGQGTVQYYPLGLALVVTQTAANHEEIRDLLTALRRLQDVEAAVELRVLKIRDDELDRFWFMLGDCDRPVVLKDGQVQRLLRAAQLDPATCIMQAPKMTLFNGQRARLCVTDLESYLTGSDVVCADGRWALRPRYTVVQTGLDCKVRPTVSADRGSVHLDVDFHLTDSSGAALPPPVTRKCLADVTVPDGRTAVLFADAGDRSVDGDDLRTVVLVTPRVIINESEEQEVLPGGTLPPIPR